MGLTRRFFYLVFALVFIFSLIPVAGLHLTKPVQAASAWVKSGLTFTPDQKYILDSTVIKDGTTYKMWYTYLNMDVSISQLFTDMKGLNLTDILNALQNDQFDTFLNNLVDLNDLASPSPLWTILSEMRTVIGYATSTDGKAWTVSNANVVPGTTGSFFTSVGFPSVYKIDDTHYQMWYTSVQSTLDQATLQTIFTNMGSGTESVRRGAFDTLLNSTKTVIKYATSTNGTSWTIVGTPVLPITGGAWTLFDSVGSPSVVMESTTNYKMWYTRLKTDFDGAALDIILTDVRGGTVNIPADPFTILDSTAFVIGYATSTDGGQTFTEQNSKVLPGSGTPVPTYWQSASNPYVVKTSAGYEMWYTNSISNMTQTLLGNVITAVKNLNPSIPTLWNSLLTKTFNGFLDDLALLDFTDLETNLNNTSTVIGHAVSTDGTTWTISDPSDFTGVAISPWSGVGAPSISKTSSTLTEMWFTQGIPALTYQNVIDRMLGATGSTGLGYASLTTTPPGGDGGGGFGGGGGFTPPTPGVTSIFNMITEGGLFTKDVVAYSGDKLCSVTIPKDTVGLTKLGTALWEIRIIKMDPQPTLPADFKGIGLFYELGVDGSTFNPPITISFSYKGLSLPPGMDEQDLFIGWRDAEGKWIQLESTVDTVNKVITAKVSHFTPFGVMASTITPPSFTTTKLTVIPSEVQVNQPATVSILVTNTGTTSNSFSIDLKIDNTVAETKKVTLAGGAAEAVIFTVVKSQTGVYSIAIGAENGTLSVKETPTIPPPPLKPADFTTSDLSITPSRMKPGDTATVSVIVTNTGNRQGTHTVTLNVNGVAEDSRNISLAGGTGQNVNFTLTKSQPGTYAISIDSLSANLVVQTPVTPPTTPPEDKPTPTNWPLIIGAIVGVIVGVSLSFFVMQYLRMPAAFSISGLTITPPIVKPGETATVVAKVTNRGKRKGTCKVALKVNNVVESSRDLMVKKGETQTVDFTLVKDNPGIYLISIDRVSSRLVVQEPIIPTSSRAGGPKPPVA